MRFPARPSEATFGGAGCLPHTQPWIQSAAPPSDSETHEIRRETPLGLPRGVFLCRLCDANTPIKPSSGVFRLCFGFGAVVIRLSGKCRLKSTLRGSSTFADGRIPSDSPTFGDSRGATLPPTLRLSDSPRLPATPRLSDYQRLSTSDFRPEPGAGGSRHPPLLDGIHYYTLSTSCAMPLVAHIYYLPMSNTESSAAA